MRKQSNPDPMNCARRPNGWPRRWLLVQPLLIAFAALGLCLWLYSSRSAAQGAPATPPAIPFDAGVLTATLFPSVTVRFPCADPVRTFAVKENSIPVAVSMLVTEAVPPPAQAALILDLFRMTGATAAVKTANDVQVAATLVSVGQVLTGLEAANVFAVDPHRLGFFVPSTSLTSAVSILPATPFTSSLSALFSALFGDYRTPPEPVIQARLNSNETTGLTAIISDVLATGFADKPAGRKLILVYSDGNDRPDKPAAEAIDALARQLGVEIRTVAVPTAKVSEEVLTQLNTGGGPPLTYTNVVSITALLIDLFAPDIYCELTFVAQQNPPTHIEIRRQGAASALPVVVAALPDSLRREAPVVEIVTPTFGAVFTRSRQAMIDFHVEWSYPAPSAQQAVLITYTWEAFPHGKTTVFTDALTTTAAQQHTTVVSATELPSRQYRLGVAVLDSARQVGNASQLFEIHPVPTATRAPTPTPDLLEPVERATLGARIWLMIDPATRTLLLAVFALTLMGFGVVAALLATPRRRPAPLPPGPPVAGKRAFAVLIRDEGTERYPDTLQIVNLYDGTQLSIPKHLFAEKPQRQPSEAQSAFLEQYQATIQCAGDQAKIKLWSALNPQTAGSSTTGREPIRIRVAGAVTTFVLQEGVEHLFHSGDTLQLGDLHYRFTELAPGQASVQP